MFLGKVIGRVVATRKDEKLEGAKLLIVQSYTHLRKKEGKPLVAVDVVQAGYGDFVYLVKGREGSIPWPVPGAPIDACIVGIVDTMNLEQAPS
ncbi:MAG: EutN/CcmL family microcompartment protein [Armatimonadetes bacterium]|nr:EutN/CcmL family microcompartment protein [Armatimonadota bacterium]